MKWFSLDKYVPPTCVYLLIRAIRNNENWHHERYFLGMIENLDYRKHLKAWEMVHSQTFGDIFPEEYTVTHFAIIPPVEIEITKD